MKRILSSRRVSVPILVGSVCFCCVALFDILGGGSKNGKARLDRELFKRTYAGYASWKVLSLADMAELYALEWERSLPLSLPFQDLYLEKAPVEVLLFDRKDFPRGFVKRLVAVEANGIATYPVTILMDAEARRLLFYNARSERIAVTELPEWFDPEESVRLLFGHGVWPDTTWAETANRMQLYCELIEKRELVNYVIRLCLVKEQGTDQSKTAVAAKTAAMESGGVMMSSYNGPSVSNIQFTSIDSVSNRTEMVIAYPDGYTNRLDVFRTASLLDNPWWDLVCTTNTGGTNWIGWTDTSTTGKMFYVAANADCTAATDSDEDGLPWGREKYLYHTSPANSDTDSDTINDGQEVSNRTDPNNPDAGKPVTVIILPANGSQRMWIP